MLYILKIKASLNALGSEWWWPYKYQHWVQTSCHKSRGQQTMHRAREKDYLRAVKGVQ